MKRKKEINSIAAWSTFVDPTLHFRLRGDWYTLREATIVIIILPLSSVGVYSKKKVLAPEELEVT